MSERSGRSRIIVISGPSGSGKTTLCGELKRDPRLRIGISATTRAPRDGEENGTHYHFYSTEEFERMIAAGRLLEHAEILGNFYGTPREPMERALAEGLDYVLNIDVQGAMTLKKALPDATFIFIVPPDEAELRRRLKKRGTETDEEVGQRLELAKREMEYRKHYGHVVVNNTVDEAVTEIKEIIFGEN